MSEISQPTFSKNWEDRMNAKDAAAATAPIDALLVLLHDGGWKDFHRALTALVAERDALRRRVAELEAQQPASDLRERLVCAALTGLMAQPAHGGRELWANHAVSFADATLAAMRKGEA